MVFPSGQTSTDVIRPREPKPGEQEDPPQCQHLSSGTSVGSPGPSIGQVALRGGSHPPAGIHPHPLPPDAPESMAPQGTLAGDQEAHSSRKNKACGQLFHSHHFICSFEYVCVSRSVVSDSSQPHRLQPARLLSPWNSPGKNTGVGCRALLQWIFPT